VLLFRIVFGGAIEAAVGGGYVNFLMAGTFVQTAIFSAMSMAAGLADDLQKGSSSSGTGRAADLASGWKG
jgi:ABC-2 type transport system permease protein